ncbi:hypothetical protein VMCG_04164 [Cytospora schulzeri]|uniref:Uncharacterized protein n=1 Tax=Cytospora schulzeri TaxID=448051 RepID=A0A423WT95_9PEZI|nr:hypothetical protein VMCG_04164 [Valsa malicola]
MDLTKTATITLLLALGIASAIPSADGTLQSRQYESDTRIAHIQAYNYTNYSPFDYNGFV